MAQEQFAFSPDQARVAGAGSTLSLWLGRGPAGCTQCSGSTELAAKLTASGLSKSYGGKFRIEGGFFDFSKGQQVAEALRQAGWKIAKYEFAEASLADLPVHRGASPNGMSAQAFTDGSTIFSAGGGGSGQLTAHELAHTVQQRGTRKL